MTIFFSYTEADVPGGMPPAAPALLPLFRLGCWTAGVGGYGNLEEVSHSPGHQVETVLIEYVLIHQESYYDHFGARHPPLHTRILGANSPDQCTAAPVGRWRGTQPLSVSMTGAPQPN